MPNATTNHSTVMERPYMNGNMHNLPVSEFATPPMTRIPISIRFLFCFLGRSMSTGFCSLSFGEYLFSEASIDLFARRRTSWTTNGRPSGLGGKGP